MNNSWHCKENAFIGMCMFCSVFYNKLNTSCILYLHMHNNINNCCLIRVYLFCTNIIHVLVRVWFIFTFWCNYMYYMFKSNQFCYFEYSGLNELIDLYDTPWISISQNNVTYHASRILFVFTQRKLLILEPCISK